MPEFTRLAANVFAQNVSDVKASLPGGDLASIPQPERQAVLLQKISAARTAARIAPRFDKMLRFDGTSRLELPPDQRARLGAFGIHRAVAQNHRRDFRPIKTGKLYQIHRVRSPALPREHVEQFPAVAAHDRLNLAMHAAVRAARNFRTVVALRTFENVSPAHKTVEIPAVPGGIKPSSRRRQIF